MDAERCPVVLEPTPHSYEVACSRCGQPGQVVVSVVERAAPAVTETGDLRAALDVGKVSIALQRSGALSKHLSYHDLARCFIAALTDGRTDLGAPDEHDRHKAAPAVTETDCCTMCGAPYDGSPLVLDHHAAGPHWHDPDGVTLHYRLSPDAAQREDRLATPAVTETGDPIDAYLASPEAVEQVARELQETILTFDPVKGPGMGAYRKAYDDLSDRERRHAQQDAKAVLEAIRYQRGSR